MTTRVFNQELTPLFDQFNQCMRAHDLAQAGVAYTKIADLISTVVKALPNERKYIAELEIAQKKCWSDLQSRSVQPIAVSAATVNPDVMREMASAGIKNSGGNDCWANAILQFLANSIPAKIFAQRGEKCKVIVAELQKLFDAQMNGKSVSTVDSQALRRDLKPKSGQRQEEAFEALQGLLDRIGFGFHIDTGIYYKGALIVEREHSAVEPMLRFDLNSRNPQFKELLENAFTSPVTYDRAPMTKKTQFRHSPDDLIIHAKRYNHKYAKIEGIPEDFELSPEHTTFNEQGIHYELTSCIIHSGKDNLGHYICLVKKPDGWYLANDSHVRKLTNAEAHELLKDGYIFHYRKHVVERPLQVEEQPPALEPVTVKPSRSCSTWVAKTIQSLTTSLFAIANYPITWYYTSRGSK